MDYIKNKEEIIERALSMLTPKRLEHTLGVRDTAIQLSDLYGGDKDRIEIAAICHDIFCAEHVFQVTHKSSFYWNC